MTVKNVNIWLMCHQVLQFCNLLSISKYVHVHVYSTQQHPHTQSNYNMWSVRFSLTIITYVLHFLYNQQNYIITVYKTNRSVFTIKLLLNQQQ